MRSSHVEYHVPLELLPEFVEFQFIQSFGSLVAAVVLLPFLEAPKPGGGPAVFPTRPDGAAHNSDVESDQLFVFESAPNFDIVLLKFCCVAVDDGLKLHVEDERISLGDVFAALFPNNSDSFDTEFIDNGFLATLPGVIDGSSSMFFCVP